MESLPIKAYLFAPIPYYTTWIKHESLLIDHEENYQKKSWRNRYQILGPNGVQTLSIPLQKGKNAQTNIKEVCIAYDEDWIKNHLESIRAAYGKAAYFEYYYDHIKALYLKRLNHLYDFNTSALTLTFKLLKHNSKIEYGSFFKEEYTLSNNKRYAQVFESKFGFVPELSILDLLFNVGPEARLYL
jgi:hypothetical protein